MKKISFLKFQMKKKLESTVNTVKYLCVQFKRVKDFLHIDFI